MKSQLKTFAVFVAWVALVAVLAMPRVVAATSDASGLLRQGKFQQLDSEFSTVQQRFERGEITGDEARNSFRAFYPIDMDLAAKYDRGGFGFSDRGVSGVLPGQYSNRRADIHEKAKT